MLLTIFFLAIDAKLFQEYYQAMKPKTEKCLKCGGELDHDSNLCPQCDDPAPNWLVYTVYGLLALFALGLVYRLIWP